ncbi:hypothetical protein [Corynebacterium pseudopelargi]|uniref:Uncharacterized protein n=1 Tax=Corynebacterium pseudopelargi TaxID=2080757 RepID=A0A3G6IV29_9CORY|nr:hypothetical protein [Corynebacterium pseudopelargi]AZA09631.1 hypothetical protein CPPEL_07615 [Corynebacterium pseudopelargi]
MGKKKNVYKSLYGKKHKPKYKGSKALKPDKLDKVRRALEEGRSKAKCCKSKPRCTRCPVVLHRLRKVDAISLDDAALAAAVLEARWRK